VQVCADRPLRRDPDRPHGFACASPRACHHAARLDAARPSGAGFSRKPAPTRGAKQPRIGCRCFWLLQFAWVQEVLRHAPDCSRAASENGARARGASALRVGSGTRRAAGRRRGGGAAGRQSGGARGWAYARPLGSAALAADIARGLGSGLLQLARRTSVLGRHKKPRSWRG
jgi:hypothetical protein